MSMLGLSRLVESDPGDLRSFQEDTLVPGSMEELEAFLQLQKRLPPLFERVFPHPRMPRTVVVIPSLSMDQEFLSKISGVQYYEERMLCMLMLLRLPHTRLVYVTSTPIDTAIIDYYLHLLPGIPVNHARKRLTLLSCHDASPVPLTQKILQRPRLVRRIREAVPDVEGAHMTCFNTSALERTLAVRLNIPLYASDPDLSYPGTKSGSREIFREAGVPPPDGFEDLRDEVDLVEALVALKRRNPSLQRAVVKHEEGASGEGNAVFPYRGCPTGSALKPWVQTHLPDLLRFEADQESWEHYITKFKETGGIVECFIEGPDKRSPSVQCRINPLGEAALVSTHDQVLGGPNNQIFLGCTFPADEAYRRDIQDIGMRIADVLIDHGALGRFGVDFVSVRQGNQWKHYPIEINLRKGGTTHPFLMLQFLTDGTYDPDTGLYYTPEGRARYYIASDNLRSPRYCGLTPEDLIDIAVDNNLHFHGAAQQGVVFHLIGALSEFGKLGVLCIADSHEHAQKLYQETVDVLDRETSAQTDMRGAMRSEIANMEPVAVPEMEALS
ncbi:MAG: peptide ligase PGM1-related protein [Rhodothermales bacterium]